MCKRKPELSKAIQQDFIVQATKNTGKHDILKREKKTQAFNNEAATFNLHLKHYKK